MRKLTIMVAMQRRPIFQSKYISKAIIATGVVNATVRSGRMCSRKLLVESEASMMILRILPLPSVSMWPNGIRNIFSTHRSRMLATVRNAPRWEQPNAQK